MKHQSQTFGRTLGGVLQLDTKVLAILTGVQAAVWVLSVGIMAIVDGVIRSEPPVLFLGLPGIFTVCAGAILLFIEGLQQFGMDFLVQINFGIARRRALQVCWAALLGYGVVTVVLSVVLEAFWYFVLTGGQGECFLRQIPAWGWLCLVLLPAALAALAVGVLRRFGKTGGLVLWLSFMILCQVPQLVEFASDDALHLLLEILPVFLPLVGLAAAAAGTVLLYRDNAAVTNR